MSTEMTPAVQRAAVAVKETVCTAWPAYVSERMASRIARDGLAAALDVEEMARVIRAHLAHNTLAANYDYPIGNQTNNDVAKRCAPLIAEAIRTALLGADS